MPEPLPIPAPEPIDEGPLAGTHRWTFQVVGAESLTPEIRRLRLTAPQLERLAAQPGQDLMVAVPVDGGASTINRRYTIRAVVGGDEPTEVVVDIVTHGHGPGAEWATTVEPGALVVAVGPRGKVLVDADAPADLFVGDAAGAPASLGMLESVPGRGRALLVVDADEQVQPTHAAPDAVTWLVGASPDEVDTRLATEVDRMGVGLHAYLAGERRDVARWRDACCSPPGSTPMRSSSKAYWSRGTANAPHGEPARQG